MPWKVSNVYEERLKFVALSLAQTMSHSELCAAHGVSRETGYKWLRRYAEGGWDALVDALRTRHGQAHAMSPEVVEAVLMLRGLHTTWGPKKLRAYLLRERSDLAVPAASTIGDLLQRRGLVVSERRRRAIAGPRLAPLSVAGGAHAIWSIDFKGWFRTGDGKRVDPLTVSDVNSRYLLSCQIVPQTRAGVQPVCDRLMREYGLPEAIRSDNGQPFASIGAGGLTKLSVHWAKLGIRLERIDPGCPQQNGRHERMHRTLKEDTSRPPAANPIEQQARFDGFRHSFNMERPHEGLAMATPASCYCPSPRLFPETIEEPWYDADHQVRRVYGDGSLNWRGEPLFLSEALAGELVGLVETENGDMLVRFINIHLGIIDTKEQIFRRFAAPRSGRRKAASQPETVNHVPGL